MPSQWSIDHRWIGRILTALLSSPSIVPFAAWFANEPGVANMAVKTKIEAALPKTAPAGDFAKALLEAAWLAFDGAGKLHVGQGLIAQLYAQHGIENTLRKVYDELSRMSNKSIGGYTDALGRFYEVRTHAGEGRWG